MAEIKFTPTKVDTPKDDSSVNLLLAIEFDKEQTIMICCGWYCCHLFCTNNVFIQDDLNRGYARVIGWATLDDLYKEARELQSL